MVLREHSRDPLRQLLNTQKTKFDDILLRFFKFKKGIIKFIQGQQYIGDAPSFESIERQ